MVSPTTLNTIIGKYYVYNCFQRERRKHHAGMIREHQLLAANAARGEV